MNHIAHSALVLLALLATFAVAAEESTSTKVYKTRDAQGNAVFSDQGSPNAQEVKIEKAITFDPERLLDPYRTYLNEPPPVPREPFTKYNKLILVSPADGEAIRNNAGNLSITIEVEPAMQAVHELQLVMNDKLVEGISWSESGLEMQNVDRGEYTANLQIFDRESGKVLQKGPTTRFTLHRFSIRH